MSHAEVTNDGAMDMAVLFSRIPVSLSADRLRLSTLVVLAIATLSGVSYTVTTALMSPEQFGLASSVYATAAETWLAGGDPYDVTPDHLGGYYFLYPPIALLVFIPHGLLGLTGAYALQLVVNTVVAIAFIRLLIDALTRRGTTLERIDIALIGGFIILSPHGVSQFIQGQTTIWLAFAVAIGIDAVDRHRERVAGVGFAFAAIIKVFPAALGLWLLRMRAWRAVLAAIVTGLGAMALGAMLLGPELTVQYLSDVLLARYERESYLRAVDPHTSVGGIRRQLGGLFGVSDTYMTPLALAILLPILAACYRSIETDVQRQGAALASIIALLMFLPLQPLYFAFAFFPLVILLYRLEWGLARYLLLAGVLCSLVMVDLDAVLGFASMLPGGLENVVTDLATAFFTVALPTDIAMWLMLGGCVAIQFETIDTTQS